MKKDFIFKTIEFSRTNEETEYYITYLEPVIPDDVKNQHPNHRFVYTTLQEMEDDLQNTLHYTTDYIASLYVNQVTYYYNPLYTTKWYIAGLYDFMHDSVYGDGWKNTFSYDKVKDGQNEQEGFVFPEKLQKLIWNKPINRIRARIMDALSITNMVSEINDFNEYKWRTLIGNTITVQNNNISTYIHFGYLDLEISETEPPAPAVDEIQYKETVRISSTKTIYLYRNISNDTLLITNPNELGPYAAMGVLAYSTNSAEVVKARDFTFSLLDANPKISDLEKVRGEGMVKLMDGKYNVYIRYRNNVNDSLHITSHYKSNLSWKRYTLRCIYITDTPETALPNNASNYTNITNNIINVKKNNKVYYQYIRYSDDMITLSDSYEGMRYIAISAFNVSDNKSDLAYNTPENYTFFSINVPCDITTATLHYTNYYWVLYGDDDTNNTYDYAIYNNTITYRNLYLRCLKSLNNATKPTKTNNNVSIKLNNIDKNTGCVTLSGNTYLYIAFSDKWPLLSTKFNTDLYYSANDNTKFIGISYTDEKGTIHSESNLSLAPGDYAWFPLSDDMRFTVGDYVKVDKPKYFYYTFSNNRTDIYDRHLTPICTTGTRTSYELFGYMFDMSIPLKKDLEERITKDRTEKNFGLYKSTKFDGVGEDYIEKVATIRVPFNAMGKYSVFNFDTVTLQTGEYLIIGGNRDTIGICIPQTNFSEENDYSYSNEDTVTPDDERPKVNGFNEMYYYAANYINTHEWEGEQYKKLPVDVGCSYAMTSTTINLTTLTYKEVYELSKLNDEQSLLNYKDSQEGKYTPPNYDLYVNLTYKFSRITDGNHDYMPLFNRYKIQCQFKNEFLEVVGEKTKFDASIMTYDGSIYNKPELIYIDNVSYGPMTLEYSDYMALFEDRMYLTIRQTDIESGQRDYDVGFLQSNNILYQLFPVDSSNPNHKEYDKLGYYNYKTIADNKYVDDLPVVCTVTVMAFDTATPIFTKNIPVALAAYSLVEITDDYIKSTVSKIEYDYLYGLTQRISRIEQYADRISMSVQNVGQGLYSQLQMTEDEIRMLVIDTSKNIGSLFTQTAESITALVYDLSANTTSKIEMLSNQILLEVSGNLTRSGILLKEDSALIYAPDIVLDGDKTTILGSLLVREKNDTGISVFDSSNVLRIFINGKNITETEGSFKIGETSEKYKYEYLYFLKSTDDIENITSSKEVTGNFNSMLIASQVFVSAEESIQYATTYILDAVDFSKSKIQNKETGKSYSYKELFDLPINTLIVAIWKKGAQIKSTSSTQNLSYMTNMQIYDNIQLYGATNNDIYWLVDGIKQADNSIIYVYVNAPSDYKLPEFKVETTKDIENCTIEIQGNSDIIKDDTIKITTEDNYKILKFELSSVIGEALLSAVLTERNEAGDAVDSISTVIKLISFDAKVIKWIVDGNEITEFEVDLDLEFAEIIYPVLWKNNDILDDAITYESTDTTIAKIDSYGNIELLKITGTTIIKATTRITGGYDYTASYILNVIDNSTTASGSTDIDGVISGDTYIEGWNQINVVRISNLNLSPTSNFYVDTNTNKSLENIKIPIPERGDYIFVFLFDSTELQNAIKGNTAATDYTHIYTFTRSGSSDTSWQVLDTFMYTDLLWFENNGYDILCDPQMYLTGHASETVKIYNRPPKIYVSAPLIYTFNVAHYTGLTSTGNVTVYYTTANGVSTNKLAFKSTVDFEEVYKVLLNVGELIERIEITLNNVDLGYPVRVLYAYVKIYNLTVEYHESAINETSGTYIFSSNNSCIKFKTAEEQRTVIGANGLYSYLDNKALLYFTTSDMIMRIANTGLRINYTSGTAFKNSMGLELLYNSEGAATYWWGAREDNWIGFHNYSPMMVLNVSNWGAMAPIYSIGDPGGWNVDVKRYKENRFGSTDRYGRASAKTVIIKWYDGRYSANTFIYDEKKCRGNILIQSGPTGDCAILLPLYRESEAFASTSDVHIPIGYIIRIINVQYNQTVQGMSFGKLKCGSIIVTLPTFNDVTDKGDSMNMEWYVTDKGSRQWGYGWYRYIPAVYDGYTTGGGYFNVTNWDGHAFSRIKWNANFLDANNTFFAAIVLPNNFYEVSFIWTGSVWKYSGVGSKYNLDDLVWA